MKRDLELTVEFSGSEFDTLKSVWLTDRDINMDLWVSEGRSESKSLNWDEWDALIAEVERYRKLKAQSEAA